MGKTNLILLLFSLLFLQIQQLEARRRFDPLIDSGDHIRLPASPPPFPVEFNVFFHYGALNPGTRIPIYFRVLLKSKRPRFITREEADSIPFSTAQLPEILKLFDIPAESPHGKAMKDTLHHCDTNPLSRETKFCATSLESLLESLDRELGSGSRLQLLTTSFQSEKLALLQNYTVAAEPEELKPRVFVGCHSMPYPYAVYYCHGQKYHDDKLYKVSLTGDDGGAVAAIAVCHFDTSQWDPNHVAFKMMNTIPGASPICHFFPANNLVWVKQ